MSKFVVDLKGNVVKKEGFQEVKDDKAFANLLISFVHTFGNLREVSREKVKAFESE